MAFKKIVDEERISKGNTKVKCEDKNITVYVVGNVYDFKCSVKSNITHKIHSSQAH